MTDTTAHTRFLAETGYDNIEAWAQDSDYRHDGVGWYQADTGLPVDIIDCLYGAMEACGWEDSAVAETEPVWLVIPAAAIDTEIEALTAVIKTLRPAINTGILWALEGTLARLVAMHRQFPTTTKPE